MADLARNRDLRRPLAWVLSALAALVLVCGLGAGDVAGEEFSADAIRSAADAELSSIQYQRELKIREPELQPSRKVPVLPPGLLEVIGWTVIAVAVVIALFWLRRFLADRRAPAVADEPEIADAPSRRRSPRDLLDEADRLARDGRYGEAVHHLLIGALGAFAEAGARFVAPPLTSREVLARAPLADQAKSALGELVAVVERAHFAGREVGHSDFTRCRQSFASIADEIVPGAPA